LEEGDFPPLHGDLAPRGLHALPPFFSSLFVKAFLLLPAGFVCHWPFFFNLAPPCRTPLFTHRVLFWSPGAPTLSFPVFCHFFKTLPSPILILSSFFLFPFHRPDWSPWGVPPVPFLPTTFRPLFFRFFLPPDPLPSGFFHSFLLLGGGGLICSLFEVSYESHPPRLPHQRLRRALLGPRRSCHSLWFGPPRLACSNHFV